MRFLFICLVLICVAFTAKAQDTIPPILDLKGEVAIQVCRWAIYTDQGVDVSDNSDALSDLKIEEEGSYLTTKTTVAGLFSLRYKGTDKAGNVGYSDWRMILVIEPGTGGCQEEGGPVDTTNNHSGISENSIGRLVQVFPNPSTGELTLTFEESVAPTFSITDITGRTVPYTVKQVSPSVSHVSLAGNVPGIYLLQVVIGDTISVSKIYLR
jgi:hypothetical protein